jgi:putative restriction endonuclease
MDREALLARFDSLNVWSRGDQRAPHKPLLVLLALGRWSQGEEEAVPFQEIDPSLTALLKEFGPPRQSYHPEYPFWRLQNDGVWVVQSDTPMKTRQSNSDPPKSELLAHHARAGFSPEVQAVLHADPGLVTEIATRLLENHFPESIHPDILSAVGLSLGTTTQTKVKRDPQFRQRILTAYEHRCAVCGFDVRLGSVSVALDAAHIKWHQAHGPDVEMNGLALCVLHHRLFDLGAFTVNAQGLLLVSDQVNGTTGFELLMRHHATCIRPAQRPEWNPDPAYLDWHLKEVFKGEPRHQSAA